MRRWLIGTGLIAAMCVLALGLAWVSNRWQNLRGWEGFFAAILLGAALLFGMWKLTQRECEARLPLRLGWLLLGAVALRLAAGIFWVIALPVWGYDTPVQRAGYPMEDAYNRDQEAWKLAASDAPLWTAFHGQYVSDQYGGVLFLSAAVYRYLGGSTHQPLLMVIISVAFSALAILFTWEFTRRVWDERSAWVAAWILALYPEAVLLSSTPMREAYFMTLGAAAFFGLASYLQASKRSGLAWVAGALVLSLPISPPFTALLIGALAITALWVKKWRFLRQRWLWGLLIGLAGLGIMGVWLSWRRLAPVQVTNPLALIGWWFERALQWQTYLTERASGWIQAIFRSTPEWLHPLIVLGYGVVQPFLPAALVATGAPLWRGVAIWRAVGWTGLLALLLYVPFKAWRGVKTKGWERALSLVVWALIVIAALRGGGDQWDNPRYRAALAPIQVALASWAWIAPRKTSDPWLRRAVVSLGLILLWFLPWYLRRYTPLQWPVVDLFKTIGLGLATAVLYVIWDWSGTKSDP
ncbi:MAG: hypothetical protein AB1345_00280 [Chloroflexota bacterium]